MRIHIARNVFGVMANLESAVQNERNLREMGQAWVSDKFQKRLETNLLELRQASADHSQISQGLAVAQRERREHMTALTRLVRDFYVVLRRRCQRDQLGKALETLYGRPARLPHSAPVIQWLEWANLIIKGEEQAHAQGYPAMINPSAADIQAVLSKASASQIQWSSYQQSIKTQEQRLRQARNQGTRALRGLAMRLREALAHETASTRREIMRTFGFSFLSTGAKDRRQASTEPSILSKMQLTPRFQSTEPKADLASPSGDPQPEVPAAQAPQHQTLTSHELMPPEAVLTEDPLNCQSETSQPEPNQLYSADKVKVDQSQSGKPITLAPKDDNPVRKTKKLSRREKKAARRALTKQAA